MNSCYIGTHTQLECNKSSYTNKKGMAENVYSKEELECLWWRIGIPPPVEHTSNIMCFHHEYMFMKKEQSTSKNCCDPFKVDDKKVQGRIVISLAMAKMIAAELGHKDIKPGLKLCSRCATKVGELDIDKDVESDENDESEENMIIDNDYLNTSTNSQKQDLNISLGLLGESPLTMHSVPRTSRANVCQEKT